MLHSISKKMEDVGENPLNMVEKHLLYSATVDAIRLSIVVENDV
jgi:hypothetical protein